MLYNIREVDYKWVQTINKFQVQKCELLADGIISGCICNPYSTPIISEPTDSLIKISHIIWAQLYVEEQNK
jgi:hypothetical protein